MSRFEDELLNHLSTTEWKSSIELMKEISAQRKKDGRRKFLYDILRFIFRDIADEIVYPSVSSQIYVYLHRLTEEGSTERRWRDEPAEVLLTRNGLRRAEWKLTDKGRRKRVNRKVPEEQSELLPSPA